MFSIWKRMRNSHCYKIMFCIGVIDMLTLLCNGLLTGYLGYYGYVFCSSPKLIYFFGAYGLGYFIHIMDVMGLIQHTYEEISLGKFAFVPWLCH